MAALWLTNAHFDKGIVGSKSDRCFVRVTRGGPRFVGYDNVSRSTKLTIQIVITCMLS